MTFRGNRATLLLAPPTTGPHRVIVRLSGGPCLVGTTATCNKRPKIEVCTTP
jgi:hypothetical protein